MVCLPRVSEQVATQKHGKRRTATVDGPNGGCSRTTTNQGLPWDSGLQLGVPAIVAVGYPYAHRPWCYTIELSSRIGLSSCNAKRTKLSSRRMKVLTSSKTVGRIVGPEGLGSNAPVDCSRFHYLQKNPVLLIPALSEFHFDL